MAVDADWGNAWDATTKNNVAIAVFGKTNRLNIDNALTPFCLLFVIWRLLFIVHSLLLILRCELFGHSTKKSGHCVLTCLIEGLSS